MEIGLPSRLIGSDGSQVYFNDWKDTHSYGGVFKLDGFTGIDAAEVRTTYEPRPQSDGAIVHPFYRGGRSFTIEGSIIPNTPQTRVSMIDTLQGVTDTMLRSDGAFRWTPTGLAEREIWAVRLAGVVEFTYVNSAIKSFVIPCFSEEPYARSVEETVYSINPAGSTTIINNGNANYYPYCEILGSVGTFTFENATANRRLHWDGLGHLINGGDLAAVRMGLETISLNSLGGVSEIRYLDFSISDFWALEPGSNHITFNASSIGGATKAKIYAHDAWV